MIPFSRGVGFFLLALLAVGFVPAQEAGSTAGTEIAWREFVPGSFRKALDENRLVLLVLDVPWNEAASAAHRTTWRDPAVKKVVEEGYVPVLVQAGERPDLVRRFPAEGWPGVSLLLPNGSPLWFQSEDKDAKPRRMTSGFLPGDKMAALLQEALLLFRSAPEAMARLAGQQLETVRETARPKPGKIDEGMVWGLAQQIKTTFDPERKYFGGTPRLPRFELIEFLLAISSHEETPWRVMGTAGLETLSAHLIDPADGALYRGAAGLDWENPEKEKLLDRNARMLDLYTLAFRVSGRKSYREQALKTAAFLTGPLSLEDGSFVYARCSSCPDGKDPAVLSGPVGLAAAALIRSGAALGDAKLVERGLSAVTFLMEKRYRPGQGVARLVRGGEGILVVHLEDLADTAGAFLAAYEVTGRRDYLEAASDLGRIAVGNLRDPKTGAFTDVIPQKTGPGPLQIQIFPLEFNSKLVRVLVRLYYLTNELVFRDAARDALKAFGESTFQSPLAVPAYALASYEYHFPALRVAVVGSPSDPKTKDLLRAAQGSPYSFVLTTLLEPERDRERIAKAGLTIASGPTLTGYLENEVSLPIDDPAAVRGGLADLVFKMEKKKAEARQGKPASPPPKRKMPGR